MLNRIANWVENNRKAVVVWAIVEVCVWVGLIAWCVIH